MRKIKNLLLAFMAVVLASTAVIVLSLPEKAEATAIPATAQVLFIGDSITNGVGTWDLANHSFPARWRNLACGQDQGCRSRVRSVGASGGCLVVSCNNQASLVDEWLTKAINITPKPTTIIVEIGVNDLFMEVTDQQYGAAYQYLMNTSINAGIKLLIATIPPTTTSWPWHNAHNPLRMAMNGWLRSYYGVANIFDIDAGLRIGSSGDADPNYYYYVQGVGDGLHPSSWGATCIADWLDPARII